MVETHGFRPADLSMTVLAGLTEASLMNVVAPMAAGALGLGSRRFDGPAMARRAYELAMRAVERESAGLGVIESDSRPSRRCVAGSAFDPVVTRVYIVRAMATNAFRLGGVFKARISVTGCARKAAVAVGEREAGFLEVVEARLGPTRGCVAVLAQLAVSARMRIVDPMAGDTVSGRIDVGLVAMAATAGCAVVLACQREVGRAVVEAGLGPEGFGMTVAAVFAEVAVVRILGAVAGETGRFRIPEGNIRGMAAFACGALVAADQRKVGQLVVECISIQADDVGSSAFMFGMAGCAFELRNRRRPAVEARHRLNVVANFRMTVCAEIAL